MKNRIQICKTGSSGYELLMLKVLAIPSVT